jgi:DNA (cytosine-5)-methyltransferase 1
MEMAGHECVGYIEIDKYARQSYKAIHNTKGEWTANDIRAVDPWELPEADCYTAGFPCQSFSIAGKRGGFKDARGTLFFEIMRLAEARKPKYLFLENVRGLLSHDGGKTFGTILSSLWELGYDAEWQVLNSKDHGVPQNRERVFIIGHLGEGSRRKVFPITGKYEENYELEKSTKSVAACLTARGAGNYHSGMQLLMERGPMLTLTAQDKHGVAIKRVNHFPTPNDINNTLRTGGKGSLSAKHNYEHIHDGVRIRRLTPLECWRLQGFPDWAFHKARDAGISDSQLYRQAGNAVTVNVVYEIARRFKEAN